MGCHLHISNQCGSHCGRKFTVVFLIFTVLYILASLAFTLTTRLYLHGYYNSAHVAGLSVFIGCFVLSHHLFKLHIAIGCTLKVFLGVQMFLNIWSLLCALGAAISYSILTAKMINLNFDYLSASIFSWIDAGLLIYLLILSFASCGGDGQHNINGKHIHTRHHKKSSASKGCIKCCNVLFGFLYLIFHLIFALIILLSAYHPAATLDNIFKYRNDSDMYTVQVKGHRPLALYLRCRGNGSETIVFENGLGGFAAMEWDFIPKELEDRYQVCIYDRRGYGWSEGFETDYIDTEHQWAENNVQFFYSLMQVAQIRQPFYYVGHSYGGIHLTYAAYLYPEMIKGLVYLDSSYFSAADTLSSLLPVINNFKSLGLFHIALATGVLDYKDAFGDVINFDYISQSTQDEFLASMTSGFYFDAFQAELLVFDMEVVTNLPSSFSYPATKLNEQFKNKTIDQPILVIDANYPYSFPGERFTQYEDMFHVGVLGADHTSLVYNFPYVKTVSTLIDLFIRLQQGQIDKATFHQMSSDITTSKDGVDM